MQHLARQHPFRDAVKHGWITLLGAARPGAKRRHRHLDMLAQPAPQPSLDPVALTMLAVNRLAPATLRTSTHGRALTVAVPDARTAEIFRAALAEMQKARSTDRLVDIVI